MARRRTPPDLPQPLASPPVSTPWVPLWPLSTAAPVSYGTSLPATPADGQEAILVDSTTNPTYQWRFRYNAGSSSAYKWEFVGGSPIWISVETSESTTSGTFVDLATVGPQFTLLRAGDYLFHWDSTAVHTAVGNATNIGLMRQGIEQVRSTSYHAANYQNVHAGSWRGYGYAASDVVKLMYSLSGAGTATFMRRRLEIEPIRVS
jgi:hypothetical protein